MRGINVYKKTILAVCVAAVLPLMVGCNDDENNSVVQPPINPTPDRPLAPVGKPSSIGPKDALHTYSSVELSEQVRILANVNAHSGAS